MARPHASRRRGCPGPVAPARLLLLACLLVSLLGAASASSQVVRSPLDELLTPDPALKRARFGQALAVGDLDGNGFHELIVGAPGWTETAGEFGGAIFIYRGTPFGLVPWTAITESGFGRAGTAVVTGDFDGDGWDEIVYGKPHWSGAATDAGGATFVDLIDLLGNLTFVTGNLSQSTLGGDPPEPGDGFGASLAVGDFDDDGRDDLAVGIPGEDLALYDDLGAVEVFLGTGSGILPVADLFIPGPLESAELGAALAAGDLDGDSHDDLAMGAPGWDILLVTSLLTEDTGQVGIVYGTPMGLESPGTFGPEVVIEWLAPDGGFLGDSGASPYGPAGARFGAALAIGDFDTSLLGCNISTCYGDLAVGAPGLELDGYPGTDHGVVAVYPGAAGGVDELTIAYRLDQGDVPGPGPEDGDQFGSTLQTGLFDRSDGFDLAIGVPGEDLLGGSDHGIVHFLYATVGGLGQPSFLDPNRGVASPLAPGDAFGTSIAVGRFRGSDFPDVAIGLPGRNDGSTLDTGAVEVIYGCLFCDTFESGDTSRWN